MSKPDPFVPADTDISGFDCFMMNVQQLLSSELWAVSSGDEFKAAMSLWCRAWTQTPPGSLPNDDKVLAAFSGAGAKWKKVRAMAMRGFVECSDGRLYHKTLCEDVLRAAQRKAERKERTAKATEARRKKPHHDDPPTSPSDDRNDDRNDDETCDVTRSHRRDGTGRDISLKKDNPPPPYDPAAATAFDVLELERRCREATGWQATDGISAIVDLVQSGVDLDDRILPLMRTQAKLMRERGQQPPRVWAFMAKIIQDPTRHADTGEKPATGLTFIEEGTEEFTQAMDGPKGSLTRQLVCKHPSTGKLGFYRRREGVAA